MRISSWTMTVANQSNNDLDWPGFTHFVAKTYQLRITRFWGKILNPNFCLCKKLTFRNSDLTFVFSSFYSFVHLFWIDCAFVFFVPLNFRPLYFNQSLGNGYWPERTRLTNFSGFLLTHQPTYQPTHQHGLCQVNDPAGWNVPNPIRSLKTLKTSWITAQDHLIPPALHQTYGAYFGLRSGWTV